MEVTSGPRGADAREYRASLRRTYVFGRARIDAIPGTEGGWVLTFMPWGRTRPVVTIHRRLSGARAWAAHYQRVSVRRANRVRHGLIAVTFTLLALLLLFVLTLELAWWGVVVFSIGALVWFLGLHELADLLDGVIPDDASDTVDRRTVVIDAWLERVALAAEPLIHHQSVPNASAPAEGPVPATSATPTDARAVRCDRPLDRSAVDE